MIQVLQIQDAVSDEQMIANWMPLSAAGLIRELCSLTLSRQLPVAAPNPCVFSKNPSFEFLNSCRLALLPRQSGVANRTPDVAGTQHRDFFYQPVRVSVRFTQNYLENRVLTHCG